MPIRVLAFALLITSSLAAAAPQNTSQEQTVPPTDSAQSAQEIDVDAMARAKDAAAATPSPVDAPPEATPTEAAPPPEAVLPETPPEAPAQTAEPPQAAAEPEAPVTGKGVPSKPLVTVPTPAQVEEKSIAVACASRAAALLDDAEKADYGNATRAFDAKMRTDLPAAKFKAQWETLSQFGKLTARGQSHLSKGEGYTVVMIPLIFEKTNLVAQINCGSDGRIAGFHVTQAPKPQF